AGHEQFAVGTEFGAANIDLLFVWLLAAQRVYDSSRIPVLHTGTADAGCHHQLAIRAEGNGMDCVANASLQCADPRSGRHIPQAHNPVVLADREDLPVRTE